MSSLMDFFRDVMMEGGTGVDAAIAGMFCNGVYSSQVKIEYLFK